MDRVETTLRMDPAEDPGGRARWPASRGMARPLLWVLPLGYLLLFFFAPLTRILGLGFGTAAWSAEHLGLVWRVLTFTLYQAALSTLLTLFIGLPASVLFSRFDFPGKALLRSLTGVPFLLPTVVVASAFRSLFGPGGWVDVLMPGFSFDFTGTLTAILAAHVFYNTTIVIRVVGSALARLDPRLEQAARSLGADSPRLWIKVFLPLLRPSLLAAAMLVFLFDFTSFGVVLLLGGPGFETLEVEIYKRILKLPDLPLASLLALIQLGCTLAFSGIYARLIRTTSVPIPPRFPLSRRPRTCGEKLFAGGMVLLLAILFLLPLASLPLRSVTRLEAERGRRAQVGYALTGEYYTELFVNRRGSLFHAPPIEAVANSFGFAGMTTLLTLAIGFPAALALARPARLERFLDPLVMLPLGASGVMLGLGFILTYGRALASPLFIPLVHALIALPFVIRALQPAIASIPRGLRDAAATLGASPWRIWREVELPILWRAVLSAALFAFTISLGEFGATLLLARPEFPTLPVAISRFLSLAGGLNYGQAMALSTILMGLTLFSLLLFEKEESRFA